jgi:WD40 repeat protein
MQHSRLAQLSGVTKPPVDDLSALEDIRVPGSCEWLVSKSLYVSWRTAGSSSRHIFWLTGNAGSGKSVLASHVINDLEEQDLRCSYFFFKHGDATKSTIARCLLSLAYQMARNDNAVLKRLLEVQQDAQTWEQWDDRTIWRRLFIGSIFKDSNPQPRFWVIDALDECQKSQVLLTLLAKAPTYLRIFITSRNTLECEQGVTALGPLVEHYQIQTEDTLVDLDIFASSRMDRLPAGDDGGRKKLKEKILRKASGSFLWVSLIFQGLEQVYSEEGVQEILEEVPSDMNNLYARMLENVPKDGRATKLAKSIIMWTLLSLRALTLDELRYVLKLDMNETVYNLGKSISAICGQLICVDQSNRVQCIHQTARAFLIQQNGCPSLAINKQNSHTRIAQRCLEFLTVDFARRSRPRKVKAACPVSSQDTDLTAYACVYFSDHLQKCSSEDSTIWGLLHEFLESNALNWIQYLAGTGKLHHITRTAKNLETYLMRRMEYQTRFPPQFDSLEPWINDLIRLSARFRISLSISPSSIHTMIPALCPSDSMFSKTYRSRQRGILVKGLTDNTWDDCLARIDYPSFRTSAVAHGERYSAVAVSDGTIFLYYRDSIQTKSTLHHGEWVKILVFSSEDSYLASSSVRKVKVWDPESSTQVWEFNTDYQCLTLLFINDNTALTAATQGNFTTTWDLRDKLKEEERWQWTDSANETGAHQRPLRSPAKALFSQDHATLAVTYHGLPIYLFEVKTDTFIGCCRRTSEASGFASREYYIDAMAFNPSPEINVLVAAYADGELVLYDLRSTELRHRVQHIYASSLACSPDGRTLVTGSSRGTIRIFQFAGIHGQSLTLTYQINAYEEGIRDIAFSSDNLRFADIRGSQCRIWEPAVLICNGLGGDSQSELSQAIPLVPRCVSMLEGPPEAEITSICHHPAGSILFCGKQDGSVAYFNIHSATQEGVLYRHATDAGITCIAYSEQRSLLFTADESGRVLIREVTVSETDCKFAKSVAEIRSEDALTRLVTDRSGSRVILQGRRSATLWTTTGEKAGLSIRFDDGDESKAIINHPLHAGHFIFIDGNDIHTFSWTESSEAQPITKGNIQTSVAPETLSLKGRNSVLQFENGTDPRIHQQSCQFIVALSKGSSPSTSSVAELRIWPAPTISASKSCPPPISLPGFDKLAHKIRQIIAVTGSLILFLDSDLWVCSVDVTRYSLSGHGAERHFFLLSEWQSSDGRFIIEYIPLRREFVVVRKHGVLVISRGLDFAEPWFAS